MSSLGFRTKTHKNPLLANNYFKIKKTPSQTHLSLKSPINFIIKSFWDNLSIPINWAKNWSSAVNNSQGLFKFEEFWFEEAYSFNFVHSSCVGTIGNKISTWSGLNTDKSKRWTPDL